VSGYGSKSNLPENFDPFIGSRSRRKKQPVFSLEPVSNTNLSVSPLVDHSLLRSVSDTNLLVSPLVELSSLGSVSGTNLSVPPPVPLSSSPITVDSSLESVSGTIQSVSPLIERALSTSSSSQETVNPTPPQSNSTTPTLELNPNTSQSITNSNQSTMAPGAFPSLSSVREIREFNGSPEKLVDFLTSVEGHLAAYNLPIYQGGYVGGDVDEGWTFVSVALYQANTANYKSNYNFGGRFCTLLAERFTGSARQWWVYRQQVAEEPAPNCWRAAPDGYRPADVVQVSFRDMIISQFSSPLDVEMAMAELEHMSWDPTTESITSLSSRFTGLFNRAHLDDWKIRRNYILRVFDDDMRRVVRFPATELLLWEEAQSNYLTEKMLSSSRYKTKHPSGRKGVSGSNKSSGSQSTGIACYTCGEAGHLAPNCPKKDTSSSSPSKGGGSGEFKRRPQTCFNCGGKGHLRPDCTTKEQTPEGKEAEAQYIARNKSSNIKRSSSPDTKKLAPKNHLEAHPSSDFNSDPGASWSAPIYMFTASPKPNIESPTLPPGLVPSILIWDKVAKQYVDTPSHYYYETRQPSIAPFNNIGSSTPSSDPVATPLALMKAMASSVPSPSLPDEVVSQKASGPMRTVLRTEDDRPILTVVDSGTHVAVVPQSVILGGGLNIDRKSDVILTSTDDMFTDPLGICDNFKFRIGNVLYSTQVYVVRKASFQLLLGTEFIWKAGIGLFPRWGAIMLSLPEFQGTCERITADKAPPSLSPPPNSAKSVSPSVNSFASPPAESVDPLSGIPLEIPRQDPRFSYLNTRKPAVPFLKVLVAPSVISISERDYLKDAELDDDPPTSRIPRDFAVPTISDTYICSVIDIYPNSPSWFKDAMVGLLMKYHQAISWHAA
jgi:Zinc knuckle